MKKKRPQKIRLAASKPSTGVIHISQKEWMARLICENSARMVRVAETFDRAQWLVPPVRKAM